MSGSATSPTATTTLMAMQRSPADPKPALIAASAAMSRSASGSTTMWFLAPPSAWTRLPCDVPGEVDVASDRRRADEADRVDAGMFEELVDRVRVAVHHVEDTVGQPRLPEQFAEAHRHGRVALRGLQYDGVAARERVGGHPQRHHDREVEGGDRRDHADRFAQGMHVDARRHLAREIALQVLGQPAGVLHVFESSRQLTQRVGVRLAVLGRDQGRQLIGVRDEQLAKREEDVGALGERRLDSTDGARRAMATTSSTSDASATGTCAADLAGRGIEDVDIVLLVPPARAGRR
jgi:hypothetical protein